MVESSEGSNTGGASRFKLIMRYRQQEKELAKIEKESLKLAKNLALTSDCLNEAKDKEQFYKSEAEILYRKAEKAKIQLEQERADKEIILQDIDRLKKEKEKLVESGKASFKRRMTVPSTASEKASGSSRSHSMSRVSKCLDVVEVVSDLAFCYVC